MRFIAIFIAGILLLLLASYVYLRRMGLDAKGTTIPQSITLAFVQRTMVRIADAEREQLTAFSECDSVDDLISNEKIGASDKERGGYSFFIECDGGGMNFIVTGRHAPPPPGSPLHWPELVMDRSLAFHAVYCCSAGPILLRRKSPPLQETFGFRTSCGEIRGIRSPSLPSIKSGVILGNRRF
jgi:hypothetical protein